VLHQRSQSIRAIERLARWPMTVLATVRQPMLGLLLVRSSRRPPSRLFGRVLDQGLVHQPLERVNKEVKRRKSVVDLRRQPAVLWLAGAVLIEALDEWQVAKRRYVLEAQWPSSPWPRMLPPDRRKRGGQPPSSSPPRDQLEHVTEVHDDALISISPPTRARGGREILVPISP
jgi:hypothetical protein